MKRANKLKMRFIPFKLKGTCWVLFALLATFSNIHVLIPNKNLFVSMSVHPSICYQLVKMVITLESHGIFLSHFAYICMSTFPYQWHAKPLFDDMGLLSNCSAFCGELVKILITLEPYGIFRSNFAYLFILMPLVCETMTRVCRASFWLVEVF